MLTPAQQQRVVAHLPLVEKLVSKVRRRVPFFPRDELRSRGYYGLCHAATRYDPDRGVSFVTFASPRAYGEMIEALRRADPRSRGQRNRGEPKPQFCQPSKRIPDPRRYDYDDQRETVRNMVRGLPRTWRTVIERHYVDGVRLKDISAEMGVAESVADYWHRQALREMRERTECARSS